MTKRQQWSPQSDEELRAAIAANNDAEHEERVRRYRFIQEEFGPPAHMLLIGGIPAMFALLDMQRSLILGNYLAAILTAQAFIEHSLGGSFALAGDDDTSEAKSAKLISESEARGVISRSLGGRLHQLRRFRNPYSHHRRVAHPESYLRRLMQADSSPEDLAEEDARQAIEIVVDFLREQSVEWRPA